ncbi:MAG: aminotransferase class V-fold PLP-dependent enzyme [Clostridia bacterium]|nr:aminotransferase class V-fold PLP-dependent enzyme [Clostridia bacterium]
MNKLALLGGEPVINEKLPDELFRWPDMSKEIDEAVLDVVHNNKMSGIDITEEFEKKFAAWQKRKYGLAFTNGTLALQTAMFAIGLGVGDEIICPTKTYWASCTSAYALGATVAFANVRRDTLDIDPDDIERCIGPRTKAIMVVHYAGYPADMDPICEIAKKHGLKIIEDVSHAQGGLYKGRMLGTFGDIAAMSLMSLKSFSCGELGMLVCDEREYYERAIAYAHYERNKPGYVDETEELQKYHHIPLGGIKGRANQICTAIGLIRLKDYDKRMEEVRRAMNYFLDLLEGTPGFHPIRVDEKTGSNMAGWYTPQALYAAEELEGLPIEDYLRAVQAETGFLGTSGANYPLHTHPLFQDIDLYHSGKPTRIQFAERDVRKLDEALRASEDIPCFSIPRFSVYMPEYIEKFARGYRKVSENYRELLKNKGENRIGGQWYHSVD